jgi:hypothetical protein
MEGQTFTLECWTSSQPWAPSKPVRPLHLPSQHQTAYPLLAGAMQSVIQDNEVKAHVFEHTTACVLTPEKMTFRFVGDKGVTPMQMIFCLKEKNAK